MVLVFDEFPVHGLFGEAGELDRGSYPNFGRLADRSVWFPLTAAAHSLTHRATAAIATGRLNAGVRGASWKGIPKSLFEGLAPTHRLYAEEPETDLVPDSWLESPPHRESFGTRTLAWVQDLWVLHQHLHTPIAWRGELPSLRGKWKHFGRVTSRAHSAEGQVEAFARSIRALAQSPGPRLHYQHVLLPHHPWVFHPKGAKVHPGSLRGLLGRSAEFWRMAEQQRGFQLQLGYLDSLLGELLDAVQELERTEPVYLAVTADHGMAFLPRRNVRDLDGSNQGEILPVPLFLSGPGWPRGEVRGTRARTVDLLPTLFAGLGVEFGAPVDGEDLFGPRSKAEVLKTAEGEFSWPELEAQIEADRRQLRQRVRQGGRWVGPFGPLVGEELPEDWQSHRSRLRGSLSRPGREDPSKSWRGLRVEGSLLSFSGEPSRVDLALVQGGRIQTVTGTYLEGRSSRFSTVLPEAAAEMEALQLAEIRGTETRPEFFWIEDGGDPSFQLWSKDGSEFLVRPGVAAQEIQASSTLIRVHAPNASLTLEGEGLPGEVEDLLLFVEGRFRALRPVSGPSRVSLRFPGPGKGRLRVLGMGKGGVREFQLGS